MMMASVLDSPWTASGTVRATDLPEGPWRPFPRSRQHDVNLTVYLTDLADLPAFRQVRDDYISLERPPASSLVRVAGLIDPAFRIEIDALAAL